MVDSRVSTRRQTALEAGSPQLDELTAGGGSAWVAGSFTADRAVETAAGRHERGGVAMGLHEHRVGILGEESGQVEDVEG